MKTLFIILCTFLTSYEINAAESLSPKIVSKCENNLEDKACEKVNSFCKKGDGAACRSMALYWAKQNDNETSLSFIRKGCVNNDMKSCQVLEAYNKQKTQQLEMQQAQLDQQRRAIAEMEEQQTAERRLQAVQALSNGLQQNGWDRMNAAPQLPMQPQIIQVVPRRNPNPYSQDNNPYAPKNNPYGRGY